MLAKILRKGMGHPIKQEAETLGGMKFCDDVLELKMQSVAAEWNADEIKKQRFLSRLLIKFNLREGQLCESGWPEASLVNAGHSGGIFQEHLYKLLMYLRKAIRT